METSATEGTNVTEAFEMLVNEVYRVLKKNGEIEQSMNTSNPTGTYRSAPKNQIDGGVNDSANLSAVQQQ